MNFRVKKKRNEISWKSGEKAVWTFSKKKHWSPLTYVERSQIIEVTDAVSIQNGSIAFILLKMSFEEPLGELAAVAPVAQVDKFNLYVQLVFCCTEL